MEFRPCIDIHNGKVKQIVGGSLKDGADTNALAGQTILKIKDFSMKQLSDGLFSFQCTDEAGQTAAAVAGIRSKMP